MLISCTSMQIAPKKLLNWTWGEESRLKCSICIRDFCLWCRVANTHHISVGELWGVETCEATEVTPSHIRLRDETSYVAQTPGLGTDAAEFKAMSRK